MSMLGHAIRQARLKRGLTQVELAGRLGVSQGAISFWEHGIEAPTLRNLIKLALELPELTVTIDQHEFNLLQRLRQLEQETLGGRCGCTTCACQPERAAG